MHKLATAALVVALGLAWSTLPAIGADENKTVKDKVKAKVSGDKKESTEDKAEAARKAEGKDTVGSKVDRGIDKTKAKARDTKDKIAAQTESSADIRQAQM